MLAYKIVSSSRGEKSISRSDRWGVPLDMANSDCRRFLMEWRAGASVNGADGLPLTYSDDAVRDLGLTPL